MNFCFLDDIITKRGEKMNNRLIIIVMIFIILISSISFANSAEPPSLIIVVPSMADQVEITVAEQSDELRNNKISKIFEPGVPSPSDRLRTIKKLKRNGFSCGMYLLPVIPFITDTEHIMRKTIKDAYEAGVDYIICGGMTLKSGKQKEYFYHVLKKNYPDFLPNYEIIYTDDKWGNATKEYYQSIDQTFQTIMKQYSIPKRIPPVLFKDIILENDVVVIILDQLHYLVGLQGKKSPYGFAAYNISKLNQNISTMKNKLQTIKGVGRVTERIILEILETGTSTYYEKILKK